MTDGGSGFTLSDEKENIINIATIITALALCGSSLWRFLIDILRTISEARGGFLSGSEQVASKKYILNYLFENRYVEEGLLPVIISIPTDQNSLIFGHHLKRD